VTSMLDTMVDPICDGNPGAKDALIRIIQYTGMGVETVVGIFTAAGMKGDDIYHFFDDCAGRDLAKATWLLEEGKLVEALTRCRLSRRYIVKG
jgi:hypothetical protein